MRDRRIYISTSPGRLSARPGLAGDTPWLDQQGNCAPHRAIQRQRSQEQDLAQPLLRGAASAMHLHGARRFREHLLRRQRGAVGAVAPEDRPACSGEHKALQALEAEVCQSRAQLQDSVSVDIGDDARVAGVMNDESLHALAKMATDEFHEHMIMHVYMCIHEYMYMHVHICIVIYIYIYISMCMHVYMCIHEYM